MATVLPRIHKPAPKLRTRWPTLTATHRRAKRIDPRHSTRERGHQHATGATPNCIQRGRAHSAKLMETLYHTPRCGCFAKSGVSKKKVRAIRYIHDLPPAPSNQCWGGLGGRSSCPNKNSLFHPKPRTFTNTTLPNIDWRGRGGVGVGA